MWSKYKIILNAECKLWPLTALGFINLYLYHVQMSKNFLLKNNSVRAKFIT